jgi:predicted N-formylglutamate amidohydrolase
MSISATEMLLHPDEPSPVLEFNRDGASPFVICVDHASRMIPASLGDLGLPADELKRHVAWDIGSLQVAFKIAQAIDAPLVAQNYSRLVIDCNRDPGSPGSIPEIAEDHPVPGNIGLSAAQIEARRVEIFEPYHDHLRGLLDQRAAAGRFTIVVALHSMTELFRKERRLMHAAVMYNRDPRFARVVLALLQREPDLVVADNEPYFMSDDSDYTVPTHAEKRGLPYVAIEIRQDLILRDSGQTVWGKRISDVLRQAEQLMERPKP